MLKLSGTSIPLPAILLAGMLFIHGADSQTISDTVKGVNGHGDEGYWQQDQPDVMILWPEDSRNIIRRFAGSAQHPYPYRLWVDPDRAGGFPVLLSDETAFDNFLEHIKANQEKDWCQVAETWSDWSGNPPAGCGVRSYTQQRTCSAATDAEKPCPDLCNPAVQTRTLQVDNGPCTPEPPLPPPPPPPPPDQPPDTCPVSGWTPSIGTVCAGESFTQSRTLADCSAARRTAIGTKTCVSSCAVTAWAPDRSTACSGETLTQTRTRADCSTDRRTVGGTRTCRQTCPVSAWAPAASTVCTGKTLTQSRTLSDCSTDTRTAGGTKYCPPKCPATGWSPSTGTVCSGETLTQSRTLGDCSTGTRTVGGTKYCPPSCPATGWAPSTGTVCSGETLTQSRTLGDCSTDTRTAGGTKYCPPKCPATGWSPSTSTVCSGKSFTQSRTLGDCSALSRTASGTKNCRKAECSNGQSYCSAYTRYLCMNGRWVVIAHGPYACFTP